MKFGQVRADLEAILKQGGLLAKQASDGAQAPPPPAGVAQAEPGKEKEKDKNKQVEAVTGTPATDTPAPAGTVKNDHPAAIRQTTADEKGALAKAASDNARAAYLGNLILTKIAAESQQPTPQAPPVLAPMQKTASDLLTGWHGHVARITKTASAPTPQQPPAAPAPQAQPAPIPKTAEDIRDNHLANVLLHKKAEDELNASLFEQAFMIGVEQRRRDNACVLQGGICKTAAEADALLDAATQADPSAVLPAQAQVEQGLQGAEGAAAGGPSLPPEVIQHVTELVQYLLSQGMSEADIEQAMLEIIQEQQGTPVPAVA